MHDYALELAMLKHEDEGIAKWQEILERCPSSNASENTKIVYTYRSRAGIAEFQGDAALAEIFYAKLIALCEAMYHAEHIHVFDYRLSHAEQIMRQGRLEEAINLSEAIRASCTNNCEWRISASSLQIVAECYRLGMKYKKEQTYRLLTLKLHEKNLGSDHRDTSDAEEALADRYLANFNYLEAKTLNQNIFSWRSVKLGQSHPDTVRAIECMGICHARQGHHEEAEAAYVDAIDRQGAIDARMIDNLCKCLWSERPIGRL